jgi:chemotaxis protein methyltransferase CheR
VVKEFVKNYKAYNSNGRLGKHYSSSWSTIRFNPKLITNVSFGYHNLFTDPVVKTFDIILCRSVMAHYDNNAKQMLFEKFHHSLNPGGCLIIGLHDALLQLISKNKFEVFDIHSKILSKSSSVF